MIFSDLKLVYKYTVLYVKPLIGITLLAIICALFATVNIGLLVPLLQLINSTTAPTGTLWNILTQLFLILHLELTFLNLLLFLVLIFLIGQILLFCKKKKQVQLRFRFISDIKNLIFKNILDSDVLFHYSQKGGQFNNIITTESESAGTSILSLTELFTNSILILAYLIMLLYISVELTIICFIAAGISFILLTLIIKKSNKIADYVVQTNTEMNEFISEHFNLLKLIKIFSTEPEAEKKFLNITDTYANYGSVFQTNGILIEILFQIIMFILAILILIVSTIFLKLSLPLILVFIFILIMISDPLRQLNSRMHDLTGNIASLRLIDQICNDAKKSNRIISGKKCFNGFKNDISLKNADFSYDGSTKILHSVSFTIKKNEMTAIVGASGGGKSTLVDLIARLIDPDQGTISIDGENIKNFDLSSYHKKIGFVSQDSYLFNDSIIGNICYGCEKVVPEKVIAAAILANAHEFIMELPMKYDTEIGDKGVKLSGGQRQRISLARALYRDPELLILDEATSSLDSESEMIIQQSISKIQHKYTIITIAHRLSTIQNSDKIVVIEKGSVVEMGSHYELMSKNEIYAKYYAMQHESKNSDGN